MHRTGLRLQPGERIMFSVRHHWVAFVLHALVPVIVAAATFGIFASRTFTTDPLVLPPPLFDRTNVVLLLVMAAMGVIVAYQYFDWQNDLLIITNKRVVHEERTLGFSYRYQTITLDRVQNVNIRQTNVLQKLFGYGRVEVQAAGPSKPIVFRNSEQPRALQAYVLGEVRREKRQQDASLRDAVVRRRLDPSSVPPDPFAAPNVAIRGQQTIMERLFPFVPVVEDHQITWHRHWTVLLQHTAVPLLVLVIALIGFAVALRTELIDPVLASGLFAVVVVGALGYLLWQYEDWRNDIYILQPDKVIDIKRLPFGFFEDRREAPLSVIQNVNITSPNLWARIFGYGDILIETAGSAGNFLFKGVSDPKDVQRVVFAYLERFQKQQKEREWNVTLDLVDVYLQQRGNQGAP